VNSEDVVRVLAERIVSNGCVAVVGAGLSASCRFNGSDYRGLPLAKDLVVSLKRTRAYLAEAADFGQAAFLIKCFEGRSALERVLKEELGSGQVVPLPSHMLLARLRMHSYVSMNFDTLLEKALTKEGVAFAPILEDADVSLLDSTVVPVIKPHGSLERPSTMCAAADETFSFYQRVPILAHLMTALLANRTALYIGFGMADADFVALVRYLSRHLGTHMPRGFAVVRSCTPYLEEFWKQHGIRFIEQDATEFLAGLFAAVRQLRFQLEEDLEPWMRNPLFWRLLDIRSLPTETQVIQALLAEVRSKLGDGANPSELRGSVSEACQLVLEFRSNYSALRRLAQNLDSMFARADPQAETLWDEFVRLDEERIQISTRIARRASAELGTARRILIYSQSQRVIDFLLAVDPRVQKEVTLYIGECRPKSPEHFQDALSTARLLSPSGYTIRLVPDMVLFHLLSQRTIDLVLMGAHAVYRDSAGNYCWFVNTCGSDALVDQAAGVGTPVGVVFERDKEVLLEGEETLRSVSFDEEESVGAQVTRALAGDPGLAEKARILNVGYDLVRWRSNVKAITE
jgi:translation initiation factor 2B subunit (eIF-2B alpha/beta/delta family)